MIGIDVRERGALTSGGRYVIGIDVVIDIDIFGPYLIPQGGRNSHVRG